MAYIIHLTIKQSLYLGTIGCACLGIGYALVELIPHINKLSQEHIHTPHSTTASHEKSLIGRFTTTIITQLKKLINNVATITTVLLGLLALVLLHVGIAAITYAAIGPLIV